MRRALYLAWRGLRPRVAVKVIFGRELLLRRDGVIAPYQRVLVEGVGGIGAVGAKVKRRDAVPDVVVLIGVFLRALCGSARGIQLIHVVVAVLARPPAPGSASASPTCRPMDSAAASYRILVQIHHGLKSIKTTLTVSLRPHHKCLSPCSHCFSKPFTFDLALNHIIF